MIIAITIGPIVGVLSNPRLENKKTAYLLPGNPKGEIQFRATYFSSEILILKIICKPLQQKYTKNEALTRRKNA